MTYETQYELGAAHGIPPSTKAEWFSPSGKTIPDVASLWPLVERGLSLDWLFTGEGYHIRSERAESPDGQVGRTIASHLQAESTVDAEAARVAIAALFEGEANHREAVMFRFAVDASLKEFDQAVKLTQVYAQLMLMVEATYRQEQETIEAMAPLIEAASTQARSDEERRSIEFAVMVARAESKARRVKGWQRLTDYFIGQVSTGQRTVASVRIEQWARQRRKAIGRRRALPDAPMDGRGILTWTPTLVERRGLEHPR